MDPAAPHAVDLVVAVASAADVGRVAADVAVAVAGTGHASDADQHVVADAVEVAAEAAVSNVFRTKYLYLLSM